ncbi:MAG TPA: hypothetical protein VKB78_03065, partial [Pirellulales bacterium]|nr:hypothetical protein [Pirellulales bacterium]
MDDREPGGASRESAQRGSEIAQQDAGAVKPGSGVSGRSGIKERPQSTSGTANSEERQPWEQMAAPIADGASDFFDSLNEPADPTAKNGDDLPFVPSNAAEFKETPEARNAVNQPAGGAKSPEEPPQTAPLPADVSNDEGAEDEVFSTIVTRPVKRPTGKGPVEAGPAKSTSAAAPKNPNENKKALWITVGAAAAAVLIAVAALFASGAFSSAPPVVETPPLASPPKLVVAWPKGDRGGSFLILDDTTYSVTDDSGRLEYKLTPGEHRLHLRRLGSAPIDVIVPPQKDGERYVYTPTWKAGTEADKAAIAALSGQDTGAGSGFNSSSDRPVAESLLDVKKWQVDLDSAKKEAQAAKKDLLLMFFGADRRDWCLKLAKEVLLKPSFRKYADPKFVFVLFEAPGANFDEGSTGAKLAADYRITSFPMLVLADSDGLPYAEQDYMDPGQHDYIKSLQECSGKRAERDKVYEPTKRGTDDEKLAAADKFVKWLQDNHMVKLYDTKLKEWMEVADRVDPKNERGFADKFFFAEWEPQLNDVRDKDTQQFLEVAEQLDKFRQKHKFKDSNRAAKLHIEVARLFDMKGDPQNTARFLQGAKDCEPTDKSLRRFLEMIGEIANAPLSSGSGFVIDGGGYLVTNNHVVEGPGKLWVRFDGEEKEVRASAVAT